MNKEENVLRLSIKKKLRSSSCYKRPIWTIASHINMNGIKAQKDVSLDKNLHMDLNFSSREYEITN